MNDELAITLAIHEGACRIMAAGIMVNHHMQNSEYAVRESRQAMEHVKAAVWPADEQKPEKTVLVTEAVQHGEGWIPPSARRISVSEQKTELLRRRDDSAQPTASQLGEEAKSAIKEMRRRGGEALLEELELEQDISQAAALRRAAREKLALRPWNA